MIALRYNPSLQNKNKLHNSQNIKDQAEKNVLSCYSKYKPQYINGMKAMYTAVAISVGGREGND